MRELCALLRETEWVEFKVNDALASLMRRFRICEERGSGIDLVNEDMVDKLRAYVPCWA